MEKTTPPSSPMMTVPSEVEAAILGPETPDDIADPAVPPGTIDVVPVPPDPSMLTPPTVTIPDALLPMAHGFCQYLQARMHGWIMDEHRQVMSAVDASLVSIRDWAREVFQTNEHAQYTLGDALARIQEHGVKINQAPALPYTAVIDARMPDGFHVTLTLAKGSAGELTDALGKLRVWLVANGYTATDGVII